jgi:hypothetical protein
VSDAPVSQPPALPDRKELEELLRRAREGDKTTLPALREMLQRPEAVAEFGGDLAEQAEWSLLQATAGKNLVWREALARKMELLRGELAGPSPTPLERLLVDRVAACWLQLHHAEIVYFQNMKRLSLPWADFHQRRITHIHRRYLAAIKALATVRRLAVPALQVNIARRQVNVTGVAPAAAGEGGSP